jgi:hypothetical protein
MMKVGADGRMIKVDADDKYGSTFSSMMKVDAADEYSAL